MGLRLLAIFIELANLVSWNANVVFWISLMQLTLNSDMVYAIGDFLF
jgi:hypothetical protein